MVKKPSWPRMKFREKGPPKPDGGIPYLGFLRELHFFDFLHRWNGGVPLLDCFKVERRDGEFVVARIKYFFSISDRHHQTDLRDAVFGCWEDLPRAAIPIAQVDIEGDDWDRCLLLTFRWGDNRNKIYLLANPHDCGPYDPDDVSRLKYLARSLPQFVRNLNSFDHFCYRTWFQLAVPATSLPDVAYAFLSNGFEDYGGLSEIADSPCGEARAAEPQCTVWCAKPDSILAGVRSPKRVAKDCSVLAIDAFRWNHAAALLKVKAVLKELKLGRSLKKIGETAIISTA